MAFTVLGGLFAIRIGLVRAMFVSGIAMALTNLLLAVLAWAENSELLFAAAVMADDLTSAFAIITFVAFNLDAGGPDLYRHPISVARLDRHGGENPLRRNLGRTGRLAGRRLGNILRHQDAHGDSVSPMPACHPRQVRRHAVGREGAAFRKRRWTAHRKPGGRRGFASPDPMTTPRDHLHGLEATA